MSGNCAFETFERRLESKVNLPFVMPGNSVSLCRRAENMVDLAERHAARFVRPAEPTREQAVDWHS
jgi:hypothetical protein